jgi:RNA polymerase sigma factor (sigma-70 family)
MLKLLRVKKETKDHLRPEQIFVERYERLRSWSLALTDNDVNLAEDLLHDAFVQFTLSGPDLETIENLDGYLRAVLRNTYLSQIRRATRSPMHPRTIVDYDSAEISLRAFDPQIAAHAQDELRAICEYALLRRKSSKAGSVLILRFFHGYYPSEIVSVLRSSSQAVSVWLKIARQEAKRYLEDPASLHFMQADEAPNQIQVSSSIEFGRTNDELLVELRRAILSAPADVCQSEADLQALYHVPASPAIDTSVLAHVVSCLPCLEKVNALVGLPSLSERYPIDTLGKHGPPRGGPKSGEGGGGSGGDGGGVAGMDQLNSYRRRARDVFEHRPNELCVSVNGLFQVSQKVVGGHSEQTLNVQTDEELSFIEVISEQEMRLLVLNAQLPPDGAARQVRRVTLSDGRTIEAVLNFNAAQPRLRIVYDDPYFEDADVETLDWNLSEPAILPKTLHEKPTSGATRQGNLFYSLAQIWRRVTGRSFWLRPSAVTGIIALILLAAILFIKTRGPVAPLSAADLLHRSAAAEETIAARMDEVLHRIISLEEKTASGVLIARHKLEIWHSAERGITARRLYNERGSLMAGDWRRADGVQTIYHHGSQPRLQLPPEKRDGAALVFYDAWELNPSAREFISLIDRVDDARVEERANDYVITYASAWPANLRGLVKATLILSRADLHPIEQTLVIQQGSEQREYHFVETGFERRRPTAVAPAIFDPDPELLPEKPRGEGATIGDKTIPASPLSVLTAPSIATPELEVEVLRLLNQAGADTGEQVSVTRTPSGQLRIEGIIDTDSRKVEIVRALDPVTANRAVIIDIATVAEALDRQNGRRRSSTTTPTPMTSEVTTAGDTFLAYNDLRRHFSDEEARRFASQMVNRSDQAMRHAGALKQLATRFTPEAIQALDAEAQAKLIAMIQSHARAFENETTNLRHELQAAFADAPAATTDSIVHITNAQELLEAIKTLFEVSMLNDRTVRAAFSISSRTTMTAIKSPQFFRSLLHSEKLADELQRARLNSKR